MAMRRSIQRLRRPYLSIGAFLAIGLAALVAIPLVIVFTVTFGTAVRNTNALLEDRAQLLITLLTDETRTFIEPAQAAASLVGELVETGTLDADDPGAIATSIRYSFA